MSEDNVAESILLSVKKLIGIPEDYDVFDPDLIMHINSVFSTLRQIGVGDDLYQITGKEETWSDFFSDRQIPEMKTYMGLKVRMLFDPPTGTVMEAYQKTIEELEWRMNFDYECSLEG